MRAALVPIVLVGCGDDGMPVTGDAAPPPLDAQPDADYFGEPCDPPSTPFVTQLCRLDAPLPKGYCTPAGICRPFCGYTVNDTMYQFCPGNETWTGDFDIPGGDRGTCYCEP